MSVSADPLLIVVVDNYDSFTHNIVHALALGGASCEVVKNDAIEAAALLARRPAGFVISAGPCTPSEAGLSLELVRGLLVAEQPTPLLGICLGHQTIAAALGARVVRAKCAKHGKVARVRHDGRGLLAGLPQPLRVARYNSLVIDEATLPAALEPTAWDEDGDLMALRHRERPLEGVQFHPESILSEHCAPLFGAWLAQCATAACDAGAARAG
ncbi:MAG: aminodeoxychorismate/anthranilate synthase component II [Deltaproteobacteria bacterium]|nr:aminodeoxychorismate/anthranilate synthase component II [Deltaproteobacteria bacterium]